MNFIHWAFRNLPPVGFLMTSGLFGVMLLTAQDITVSGLMLMVVWMFYPIGQLLGLVARLDLLWHKTNNLNLRIRNMKYGNR